jgi:hypothetical protein
MVIDKYSNSGLRNTAELTCSAPGITGCFVFLCMLFQCQTLNSLPDLDNSLCIQLEAGCRIQERNDVGIVIVLALIERILMSSKGHGALNVYNVCIIQLFCYFIVQIVRNNNSTSLYTSSLLSGSDGVPTNSPYPAVSSYRRHLNLIRTFTSFL